MALTQEEQDLLEDLDNFFKVNKSAQSAKIDQLRWNQYVTMRRDLRARLEEGGEDTTQQSTQPPAQENTTQQSTQPPAQEDTRDFIKDNSYASVAAATPGQWVRNSKGEAQLTKGDIEWANKKLKEQQQQQQQPAEERVSSEDLRFYDPATGSWLVADGTKNIPADAIPASQYDSWQEENLKDEDKDEIRGAITDGITGGDFGVTKDKEYTPKKKSASKKTSSSPAYKKARDER
mgnify:CR=1 FL=1